jgi:hypothetical protein
MSVTTARVVRRLRLRGPTEALIQRAIPLVEDAIRTAALPGDGGRIVLVRRMAIGRIDSYSTSQSVGVDIGRAWEQMAAACVHGACGDLTSAPAVWFRDALEAHAALALRVLAEATANAWYWRIAVPAWRPWLSGSEALRRIMLSLGSLLEAPAALPQWTLALAHAGHAERLVAALRVEDVAPLARASGLRYATLGGEPREESPCASTFDTESTAQVDATQGTGPGSTSARLGAGASACDPRREMLGALLLAAGSSAPDAASFFRGSDGLDGADPPEAGRTSSTRAHGRLASPANAASASAMKEVTGARSTRRTASGQEPVPASSRDPAARPGSASHQGLDGEAIRGHSGAQNKHAAGHPYAVPGTATRAGGLLFIVPVLARLGYGKWIESQPAWARVDVASHLFAQVLARLEIDVSDPAWQVCGRLYATTSHTDPLSGSSDSAAYPAESLGAPRERDARTPPRFVAPAVWREEISERARQPILVEYSNLTTLWDASGRLLLGSWRGPCPRKLLRTRRSALLQSRARDDALRPWFGVGDHSHAQLVTSAWLVAARRWLRRHAGIGIASLVRRPASLALSPTHADLVFELATAEIRIRRAGLDINPGWVPWFGRVVTFHYFGNVGPGLP